MSETSKTVVSHTKGNDRTPGYFACYVYETLNLFSENDDIHVFIPVLDSESSLRTDPVEGNRFSCLDSFSEVLSLRGFPISRN